MKNPSWNKTRKSLVCLLYLTALMLPASAGTYYDDNLSDSLYWTHRIPITVSETGGVRRLNEPVTLNVSQVFGSVNLSLVDWDSLRLVDPEKKRVGELNGHVLPFQLDDDGNGVLSPGDELSFLAEVEAYKQKTYYLYYADYPSGIQNTSYESDLAFTYDGKNVLAVENERMLWEGFTTGYFAVYRAEPKKTKQSIAYSPLGLDHGYIIEASKSNDSFVRYDKNWGCALAGSGPVRVKAVCKASSGNFDVSKTFTFYAKNSFYETVNTIQRKNSLLANVKWVIYDVVRPYFSNDSNAYSIYSEGSGEKKISYLKAFEDHSGRYWFELLAKGDVDLYFEDKEENEFDLFGETIQMAGESLRTVSVRHALVEAGSEDEGRQYVMFTSPIAVGVLPPEENKLAVIEPNQNSVYDLIIENESIITLRASIANKTGVSAVYCDVSDSFGKTIYASVKLYNDGTHGDAAEGDDVWTNGNAVKLYPKDVTGIWSIVCREEGSQSVATKENNTFYVVNNGGYRRIEFFNIYCKSGERFKHNPALVRPGGTAELHICLMNTGTQDEDNIRVSIPDVPLGWKLDDVLIERLVKGDEIPTVMRLFIPETQNPSSKRLTIEITANGTLTGTDSVLVDVVAPKIESEVSIKGKSLLVTARDEGAPIPDAQVKLSYATGKVQSATTDAQGVAEVPAIDSGDILITVSKMGYNSTETRLSVSEPEQQTPWLLLPVLVVLAILAHLAYTYHTEIKAMLKKP